MRKMKTLAKWKVTHLLIISTVLLTGSASPQSNRQTSIPYLRKQGTATQLIVDGNPLLVLAGELGNSSSSSLDYMRPIWPKLAALQLNTILVQVYWELIEP